MEQADIIHIVQKIHSKLTFNIFGKIGDGKIQLVTKLIQADFPSVIAVYIIDNFRNPLLIWVLLIHKTFIFALHKKVFCQNLQQLKIKALYKDLCLAVLIKI